MTRSERAVLAHTASNGSEAERRLLRSSPLVVDALASLSRLLEAVPAHDLDRESDTTGSGSGASGKIATLAHVGVDVLDVASGSDEARMLAGSLAEHDIAGATRVTLATSFLMQPNRPRKDHTARGLARGPTLLQPNTHVPRDSATGKRRMSELREEGGWAWDGDHDGGIQGGASGRAAVTALPCREVLEAMDPDSLTSGTSLSKPSARLWSDPTLVCVTISGLQPSMHYTFRAASVSDSSPISFFSEPSEPVRTAALDRPGQMRPPRPVEGSTSTSTVDLDITMPDDDGGMPVIGVLLFRQDAPDADMSSETLLPPARRITVRGLRPVTVYRFSVAAVTAMGVGPLSQASDPVSTDGTAHGGRHPGVGADGSRSQMGHAPPRRASAGMVVSGVGSPSHGTGSHRPDPHTLAHAHAVRDTELDAASDAFGAAFRDLGPHGRVVFAAHVAARQLQAAGKQVDLAAFLRRSGLERFTAPLVQAAEAEVSEALAARRSALHGQQGNATSDGVADDDLAVKHQGAERHQLSNTAIARIEAAAKAAQAAHPHRDSLFGPDTPPLAHRLQAETALPSHGAVVTLSDVRQTVTLHPDDGFPSLQTIQAWASHWSPRHYDVHAELVQAWPLHGADGELAQPRALNSHAFRDRIVVFSRGSIPLAYKIRIAASHGALAAIVVDLTDRCADEEFGQGCVSGSAKQLGEGWAMHDRAEMWEHAQIPALLVGRDAGRYVLSLSSR